MGSHIQQVSLSQINNDGVCHLRNGNLIKANAYFRRALQLVRRDLRSCAASSSASATASSLKKRARTTSTSSGSNRSHPKFIPTAGYSNLNLLKCCGGGFSQTVESKTDLSAPATRTRWAAGRRAASLQIPTSRAVPPQVSPPQLSIYSSGICIDDSTTTGANGSSVLSRVCSDPIEDHKICASIVVYNNALVLHLHAMTLLKQPRFDDDVALQAKHLFGKAQTLYQQAYKLLIGVLMVSPTDDGATAGDDDEDEKNEGNETGDHGSHAAKRRRVEPSASDSSTNNGRRTKSSSPSQRNAAIDLLAMALVNNLAHIRLELCDYADSRRLLQLLISIAYSMQPSTYGCDPSLMNFMEWQRQLFLRNAAPNMHPLPAAAAA